MTTAPPPHLPLSHSRIAAPLAEVARRHNLRSLLLGLFCGAAAGTASAAAALAGEATFGPAIALGLLAGVAVGGLAVWITGARQGGDLALAARIDRAAALDQGYLTAVDLDRQAVAPGPVGGVLFDRMDSAASAIDPARVLPLADRPMLGAALAALIGAAVLGYAASRGDTVAPPAPVAPAEDPLDAARDAAERIAADAEALDDPYLEAVARALQDRLDAADPQADGAALEQDIEDLLEHAARAYGEDMPDWLSEAGDSRLADLGERLDAFDEAQALEASLAAAEAERRENMPFSPYSRDDEQRQNFADRDTEELIAGAGAESGEQEPGSGDEPPAGGADSGPRPMTPQDLEFAGRIPVGAALNSGRGESNEAGLGSETLEDDSNYADIQTGQGDDVVVSSTPADGGNRIRIEIAPETGDGAPSGAAPSQGMAGGGGFAAPADRVFVPPGQMELVARYLDRRTAE